MPNWKKCPSTGQNVICVVFDGELDRRLEAMPWRFGWLNQSNESQVLGVGPYCLQQAEKSKGAIQSGFLKAKEKTDLSEIRFWTSQEGSRPFDLALQGSTDLENQNRKNISPQSPLPYYIVTNPAIGEGLTPWQAEIGIQLIRQHLIDTKMVISEKTSLDDLVPHGRKQSNDRERAEILLNHRKFFIPDYIPQCKRLADALRSSWDETYVIECGDLVSFVLDRVWEEKESWGGFLISFTPSAPLKNSIRDQYFSGNSTENFLKGAKQPDDFFQFIGMGLSWVTVNKNRICGIKPNSQGLSDLAITDIEFCKS